MIKSRKGENGVHNVSGVN